jgi:hypothetical protein
MKNAIILSKKKMKQIKGNGEFPIWELNECLAQAAAIEDDVAADIMTEICFNTIH